MISLRQAQHYFSTFTGYSADDFIRNLATDLLRNSRN